MKILAIETATEICSVAYCEEGRPVAVKEESAPRKHSEVLPLFFEEVKDAAGFSLEALDGIAVSIGPGSFTGLRIGLSYAKGLAFSRGLPLVPVPTLLALAGNAEFSSDHSTVLLFSHRDILFSQSVDISHGLPKQSDKPQAMPWENVENSLDGDVLHWNCGKFLNGKGTEIQPSASAVGRLADEHFSEWVNHEPFQLVPEYISPFETGGKK